ncbi:MAG TPA: ABC transporter ATP-binding protein [Oscillospiraceae bacterium]|nr:ABC transporter ATP-binding protein [Oscillospiraceae bacterium]
MSGQSILDIEKLGIDFGGLHALDGFSLHIEPGEIVGLIGPNGAGKTTVFNLLTSVYAPTRGKIELQGENTKGKKTHQVAKHGIARTFQNIRLFSRLTVLDNILIGMHNNIHYSILRAIFRLPRYWKEEAAAKERALELLDVFDMRSVANEVAGSLPYGAQRRIEIVRALATDPQVLLLDEPAAGMNPSETEELMANIRRIRDKFGVAIFLIEHDMSLVMGICERILVLNYGLVIAEGTPEEIKTNPTVIEAYLGQQRSE